MVGALGEFLSQVFQEKIQHRGEIKGQDLGDDQSSNDDKAERDAALGRHAADARGDRDSSHEGGEGGHEDGAETGTAGVLDGF